MKFGKPAKTAEEQVDLLRTRGMAIADPAAAAHYLLHLNYYRLTGYWLLFEESHEPHRFRAGTRFEHVLNLYSFDRELRLLLLDAIERIEVSIFDVIYAKVTPCFENGKGALVKDLECGHAFGTTELTTLRPTGIDGRLLYLTTMSEHFRGPGASEMLGSGGLKRVPDDFARNFRVALPPHDQQAAIAAALDRETARIDALIAKKTRFIELLKEKRQALITHAVTRGLGPKVKMKNCGADWIGEVPEHWSVSKLAYVATERGGKTPTTSVLKFWDGNIPWVSPKDMKSDVVSDSIDKITDAAVTEFGMARIPPCSILVVVRGMILAHSFPVAETAREVTINQDMKALAPIPELRASYLRLLLQSAKHYVVNVLVAEAAHGTRVLRTDIWKQLPIFLPPVAEQDAILMHIANATARLDALRDATLRSIDLLKERRSALITAAVTGQIDLREAA